MKNNMVSITTEKLKDLQLTKHVSSTFFLIVTLVQILFFFLPYERLDVFCGRAWYITFAPWLYPFGVWFISSILASMGIHDDDDDDDDLKDTEKEEEKK